MTTTQTRPDLASHRPTRTTVGLVIVHDGKLLLQRQPKDATAYANTWDLPGAEVPAGAPEDVVADAAREQLGIEVTSFVLLSAGDDLVEDACWRRFVYRVRAFDRDVSITDASLRWYSEKEFADVFQLNPLVASIPVFEA